MSERQRKSVTYLGLRGRDGSQVSDLEIPLTRAKEMLNVDLYRTSFARKRGGSAALATTGGTAFSGSMAGMTKFIPGADETAAQLFAMDTTGLVKRLAAGTAWANVTLQDANSGSGADYFVGATLNGKHFVAYLSGVDRLHCWDPATSTIRRVGIQPPAAPTAADTGAGAYAATARTYKVAYTLQVSGVTTRRSELSAALSFTPSGSGTHARVTKPAALSEQETHWELYGAATVGDTTYKLLATTVVATTTYDDNTAPSSYSGTAPPTVGANTVPSAARFLLSDGNRLIMAGNFNNTFNNRVWFTAVLGASDVGDDERVPNTTTFKYWIDLDENDGGFITGLGGPLDGVIYVFKQYQVWRLIPTGDADVPYVPRAMHKASGIGSLTHKGIVMAEDDIGRPALYFWSPTAGCYRIGARGLQYCGRDNEDYVANLATLALTGGVCGAHGVYHRDKRQVWFWVATGSAVFPGTLFIYDVRRGTTEENGEVRGGWTRFDGTIASGWCSVMFANTPAASMSRDNKPYLGTDTATIVKGDTTAESVQAYVDLPARYLGGIDHRVTMGNPLVLAGADSMTLQVQVTQDYGLQTARTDTESFTPAGSETRLLKRVEGLEAADAGAIQVRVGDASANADDWVIDAVVVPYEVRETV